jgi:carbon-monoxide dehydrogenase medium subunit
MKPAPFTYHAPRSLDEALSLAASLENARLLAGGQSLLPLLNFRLANPDHLIDLGRVEGLAGIEATPTGLSIGAMTTQRELERSPRVREFCPLLAEALKHVGHAATRNRGTIGGSLCHLDPAAELPVVATALDAKLTVASLRGARALPFREFSSGYLTNRLEAHEILVRVELPRLDSRAGWAFTEMARRKGDFAIVSVAATLLAGTDGVLREARVAVGGLGAAPVRATAAEQSMVGRRWEERLAERAGRIAAELPANGDDLYPADYRRHLAGVLARRALLAAARRLKAS